MFLYSIIQNRNRFGSGHVLLAFYFPAVFSIDNPCYRPTPGEKLALKAGVRRHSFPPPKEWSKSYPLFKRAPCGEIKATWEVLFLNHVTPWSEGFLLALKKLWAWINEKELTYWLALSNKSVSNGYLNSLWNFQIFLLKYNALSPKIRLSFKYYLSSRFIL